MAEIVQKNMELMIPEFEDLKRTKLLPEESIRVLIAQRRNMESKIHKGSKHIRDFIKYINHETQLLKKIRKTRDKTKISDKKGSIDFCIIRRIKRLYQTAVQRFSSNFQLHKSYFEFLKEHKFNTDASLAVDNIIKMFSFDPEAWILAAEWYCHSNNKNKALQVLQKGFTIIPDCISLYYAALKLEFDIFSKINCTPEEKLHKEKILDAKIKTYMNLIFKNINDFEEILSTMSLLEGHKCANSLQQMILERSLEQHSKNEIFWDVLAKRELKGMHFVTDENEQERSDNAKSCIMYCIDKYEQGLRTVTEEKKKKLWSLYLLTLSNMIDENRESLLQQTLARAHEGCYLEENHYKMWIELVSDEEAKVILDDAIKKCSNSELLWKLRFEYALKSKNSSDINQTFKNGINSLKNKALCLWLMFFRFYSESLDSEKIRSLFEDGVKETPEISNSLKPKYVEWLAIHAGIDAARSKYSTLAVEEPYCKELHQVMSKIELSQLNVDHEHLQKVNELACAQFGEEVLC